MSSRRSPVVLVSLMGVVLALLGTGAPAATAAEPVPTTEPAPVGVPPQDYVIPATSFFSHATGDYATRTAIRNKVLNTIESVWGGPRDPLSEAAVPGNGSIRIATWSFDDMTIAKALVAAHRRGVSVQVVAASDRNGDSRTWNYLRTSLGPYLYKPGYPNTADRSSFARECRGSCRGAGGTHHSKYFMFDNVGSAHARNVVVQTSANLTTFAVNGQWNQAQVWKSAGVYEDYLDIFRETRIGQRVANPYHVKTIGPVTNIFFPRPGATASGDPVMQTLNRVSCTSAGTGGTNGRTKIRVIQYTIYGQRGTWIAKKLRSLWNSGCDVGIIYSVSSRPVLSILRNRSGRGAIPMRQSVIKNRAGEIVKYNHSKWMTINGRWAGRSSSAIIFTGSSNWADMAFGSDEQMQRISSSTQARRYLSVYSATWRQKTSTPPSYGRVMVGGRAVPAAPENAPAFGQGMYKYMTED